MNDVATVTAPHAPAAGVGRGAFANVPETIDVWKTSCPRLSVWEDAVADGLVRIDRGYVFVTTAGSEILAAEAQAGCSAPTSSLNMGSPRIGSKSESSFASVARALRQIDRVPKVVEGVAVRPARLSQHATL